MENFKLVNNSSYYKSTLKQGIIALNKECKCGRSYYQKYQQISFTCYQCNEIKNLKEENNKLKIGWNEETLKSFSLARDVEDRERKLSEKDLTIEDLKKKLAIFEASENLNHSISAINLQQNLESELESTTSHSDSNYSLIEEQQ